MKKTKKKKWTEEDDKKIIEDYKNAVFVKIQNELYGFWDGFEAKDSYCRVLAKIEGIQASSSFGDNSNNNAKFGSFYENMTEYFSALLRKKPVKDVDLEGKRVLLKVTLKIQENEEAFVKKGIHEENLVKEKEEELRKIEEERIL